MPVDSILHIHCTSLQWHGKSIHQVSYFTYNLTYGFFDLVVSAIHAVFLVNYHTNIVTATDTSDNPCGIQCAVLPSPWMDHKNSDGCKL